jgi:hypothetical protein
MKNLTTLIIISLITISSIVVSEAQPQLTVWRVAEDHLENHDHSSGETDKIEYECGTYYYMTHTGDKIDMHIALRNDGNQDLHLELPIHMSVLSSEFLAITSNTDVSTLAPGEETIITISYLNTGAYVPGQRGVISFKSNDFINPMCGFSIEVGGTPTESYCVCEDGELTTIGMMDGGPGGEEGSIIPIQPNQFRLHSGPCDPMVDECPAEESLTCYYSPSFPNFRTYIAGNLPGAASPSAAPIYLEVAPGYCPCILESNFCISEQEVPPTVNEVPCLGEPLSYEVFSCCARDVSEEHIDHALPDNYNYEWCTDGLGMFQENTGMTATIVEWFPRDYIFVKVTNEEGCLGVGWREAPSTGNELWITLENEGPVCIQDDLELCLNLFDTNGADRNSGTLRSEGVEWLTNGDGIFSNPTFEEGQHCITISGMKYGDKVYAIDHQAHGEGCPPYGVYNSIFQGPSPCTEAFENRGLGGINLDDPCNCNDPLNIPPPGQGTTQLFHDVLTIENLFPGEQVLITPDPNFLDSNGAPVGPFTIDADMWGRVEFDFWHEPGVAAMAQIEPEFSNPEMFTSSVCEACIPIPTLSQWGIIILSMIMLIAGLVAVRMRKLSLG